MKQTILALLVVLVVPGFIMGQKAQFDSIKEEIAFYADIMVNAELDRHRMKAHQEMVSSLDSFLSIEGSYEVSLDSIRWFSVVHGEDFRFVTWQLRVSVEEYKYGGFIQWAGRVVQFKDTRPFINGSSTTTYTPSGWYGCIYYQIVPFEKDGKPYYILLGFNAENSTVNTKVADILDLTGPEPRLGVPVFTGNEEPRTRLMMTYADVSNAHMNYDSELKGIVLDHMENLSGIGPGGETLPVSDGSLEAWILSKGNWVYEEEVYDVKQKEPPMTDERKDRKEDKDILGRPRKDK